ncbi:NAD(P)/FAD-dependent oxidoreductase [Saccharopolyspora gloriosae]|uniref:Thioredoxin reductase (NADPH) n=1 Tax=Saccharopolyspora gloriosae TaxID=455344 RepID=A0A840NFP1_9PSEU|nr:NAD(P)/FAD-dependent oxidoreductase [Saccharopolyspora gloriosae]MBB5069068.1 thioredoxin reductase (NADPH) [Saccharopolyspora gloriosae]
MLDEDVVIIGGGAAGLAAAMMLGRSRRQVVLLDAGEPRNAPSRHLHGFPSRDGADPAELVAAGRGEVRHYGGEIRDARVSGLERADGGFAIRLDGGDVLTARAVLVATGLRDELPEIAGLRERWGRDVLHCPYCHGFEVRDTPLAVVGGDNRPFSLHQAQLIRQWSDDVVFLPNRIALTDDERHRLLARGVRIVDGEVARVVAEADAVSAVELADGRIVARSTVFVGPRFVPRDELLTSLGCEVGDDGWVRVDPSGQTSVAGVWAAGNVSDSPAQLVNAAAAGSKAAIALNHHLLADDIDRAIAAHDAR